MMISINETDLVRMLKDIIDDSDSDNLSYIAEQVLGLPGNCITPGDVWEIDIFNDSPEAFGIDEETISKYNMTVEE